MATPATAPPDTPDFEGAGTPVRWGGGGETDGVVENVVLFAENSVKPAVVEQLNFTVAPIQMLEQLVAFGAPGGQITVTGAPTGVCVSHFCPGGVVDTVCGGILSPGAGLVGAGVVVASSLFIWAAIPK